MVATRHGAVWHAGLVLALLATPSSLYAQALSTPEPPAHAPQTPAPATTSGSASPTVVPSAGPVGAPAPGADATDAVKSGTTKDVVPPDAVRGGRSFERAPPPSSIVYFQYGVAFAAEGVVAPGPICNNVGIPCIFGGGGGITIRGGWRSNGPIYLGVSYELTKQDPNKLYRLALLQQARAEGRYYFTTFRVTEPYALASLGVAGYGNEWSLDSIGPVVSLGVGVEYQVTRTTVVGIAAAYRLLHLSRFTDTAGTERAAGFAQLFGLDFVLEQRDALLTGGDGPRKP